MLEHPIHTPVDISVQSMHNRPLAHELKLVHLNVKVCLLPEFIVIIEFRQLCPVVLPPEDLMGEI
jgi:hypothetical protein